MMFMGKRETRIRVLNEDLEVRKIDLRIVVIIQRGKKAEDERKQVGSRF